MGHELFSFMEKNYLFQLTNNLYRLTLFFPKKEPLRYKMREVADEILAIFISLSTLTNKHKSKATTPSLCLDLSEGIVVRLEILDGFFEVAKNQNWVAPIEVLRVQEEYNRIKAEIKKIAKRPPEVITKIESERGQTPSSSMRGQTPFNAPFNERQQKILEFLRENGRAQVWQVKQVFPAVTKRTLRRDFESLLKQGIIERVGEHNDTFYQIKKVGQA